MKGRRLRGSSLVEMLISVLVLSIVLIGMLAGVTVARMAIDHKAYENAKELGLHLLEWAEAIPLSADSAAFTKEVDDAFPSKQVGGLEFKVERKLNDEANPAKATSADVTVTVHRISDPNKVLIPPMKREVSASGWKNAGEFEPEE